MLKTKVSNSFLTHCKNFNYDILILFSTFHFTHLFIPRTQHIWVEPSITSLERKHCSSSFLIHLLIHSLPVFNFNSKGNIQLFRWCCFWRRKQFWKGCMIWLRIFIRYMPAATMNITKYLKSRFKKRVFFQTFDWG